MLHRVNRILTMAVLILLSLVLITTSVVSGIFAKYTLTRSIKTTLGFMRNGIKVEIEINKDFKYEYTVNDEGVGIFKIEDLKLKPGDDFSDALKLIVSGSPVATSTLSVDVSITYNDNSEPDSNKPFEIPTGTFKDIATPTYYMPIGFKVGTYNENGVYTCDYASTPYVSGDDANENGIEAAIENKIADFTDLTRTQKHDDASKMYTSKQFEVNKRIMFKENVSALGFGFDWPVSSDVANSNEIGTWISNQGYTFDITYTISVD